MVTETQRREEERKKKEQRERIVSKKQASLEKEREAKRTEIGLTARERLEIERGQARRAGEPEPLIDIKGDRIVTKEILSEEQKKREEKAAIEEEEERVLTQEEIIERERLRREGGELSVEEIPPEELPPVTEQSLVEQEEKGALQKIEGVYNWVDSLGGIAPPLEEQFPEEKFVEGVVPITVGGGGVIGVKKGKEVLTVGKAATGARAIKIWGGILGVLKNQFVVKAFAYGTAGYALWGERSISNIDSALSQVRESITIPVSMATALSTPEQFRRSYDLITDLEDDVNEYESMIKTKEKFVLTTKITGRTLPVYQRISKLRIAMDLAREQIAKVEASGRVPTDEETAFMLQEINEILDSMENPSKFLGIF